MQPNPPYQLILLGTSEQHESRLRDDLAFALEDLGLSTGAIAFLTCLDASSRSPISPTMAVFFGSSADTSDTPLVSELIEDSIVIAPVVSDVKLAKSELPPQLTHINATVVDAQGGGVQRLTALILETFRLLRRGRRLFISYKRTESQPFADLLYDALDSRGFDVFIDVRSVPPAEDFQSVLWHRMADCDVVILIDTPGFRASRWTVEELTQANATNVQILHLLWPGQTEDLQSSFSHFVKLRRRDFVGLLPMQGGWPRKGLVPLICDEVERLRAPAMAARHRYLVDNFCDAARDLGLVPAVQTEGWISLVAGYAGALAIVPAIGVPTSDRINEIFSSIAKQGFGPKAIWVIYDHRGIMNTWITHLNWLDSHLPIRAVPMSDAPRILKESLDDRRIPVG